MGTAKKETVTGLFVRERFTMRIWEAIRGLMGRRARDWQPVVACVCCHAQIEQRAAYCPGCGVYQRGIAAQEGRLPQTEAIQRLPSTAKHTEKLTSQMYAVRIGELRPIHQYLAEQKRKKAEEANKKAEEALRDEARRRAI